MPTTRLSDHTPKRDASPSRAASLNESLNRAIVDMLGEDGRMPFAEIAAALGVSEGTVRNRVNSMKAAGLLRIVAIADPVAAEYTTDAMLGIKVAAGHNPAEVAERLSAHDEVIYVLWVSGRFDLLVEVVSDDQNRFLSFLQHQIYDPDDIAAVETMTGLQMFKNQFLLKRNWVR